MPSLTSWHYIERLEERLQARLIATHELDYKETVKLAPDAWYE